MIAVCGAGALNQAMLFVCNPVCRLLATGLLTAWPWLTAGVLIVESQQAVFHDGGERTLRIQIDRDRVSVDVTRDEKRTTYIFRGDLGAFWIVDYTEKVYREITQEVIETVQHQRGRTRAAMEARVNEQLQTMPPAQRQEIESNMRERLSQTAEPSSGEPDRIRFEKIADTQNAGNWTCDWYEGLQAGQKVWEVCAADWPALGVRAEDFGSLEQMARLLAKFGPEDAQGFLEVGGTDWKRSPGYPGIPVSRISYREGHMQVLYEVTEVRQQELPDSVFEPPAGFQRRALVLFEGAFD